MQALILAAGMGRRLGELTKDNTKCMVEMGGERLIDRLARQLAAVGVSRIVVVTGYKGANLRRHLGNSVHGVPVGYVDNPVYDKTNNIYSLWLAREELQEEDTLLVESDIAMDDNMLPMLAATPEPDAALVARYEPWMDGTMVTIDGDGNIANFVSKREFDYSDRGRYYKTVNAYKLSRNFSRDIYVPFLDAYSKAMGLNEYYEQVLRVITLIGGLGIKAVDVGGCKWYEIDDIQDLDTAETIFSHGEERLARYNRRYGGYWRFGGLLDFCYLVNPYFPPQEMKEEIKASMDSLLTEYPSGMGVNSMLAGKCFGVAQELVAVGNGAAELIKSLTETDAGRWGVIFPTFEEYPNRLPADRVVRMDVEQANLQYSAQEVMDFFDGKDIGTLLLISPDNPSGSHIPKADTLRLAAWCRERGVRLVVDESFSDFCDNGPAESLLDNGILRGNPNLTVVKSISKSFGVPGLRLGVVASAEPGLISKVKADVSIWNINSFAEFYMQIYNKYENRYAEACAKLAAERRRFAQRLADVPFVEVLPSQANYFLCRVKPPMDAKRLALHLLENHDILIKDCGSKHGLEGRNFVRISIRGTQDNDRLADALAALSDETGRSAE